MNNLLLVEDDHSLGYILKEYIELNNFSVTWVQNGIEGLEEFKRNENSFDLCILDVMMPKKDGFTLASEMREIDRQVPIIFLTAKTLKVDKLKAFKIGCDDYIVKPIDEEILIARIHAVIRRTKHAELPKEQEIFQVGSYTFDYTNQKLLLNEQSNVITMKEAELLRLLCLNKGQILDRNTALKRIWGDTDYFNRRSMDVFISRLRKYLSDDTNIKITNVHGKGFILDHK